MQTRKGFLLSVIFVLFFFGLHAQGPGGYTKCADENGQYSFSQPVDVAYGANGKFAFKSHVTGAIKFDNATFGDPAPGMGKAGYYKNISAPAQPRPEMPKSQVQPNQQPAPRQQNMDQVAPTQQMQSPSRPPDGFTKCADENGEYNFSQPVDVAYGANGKFAFKSHVTGAIKFDNATFGDPAPGVGKAGYYKNISAPEPRPEMPKPQVQPNQQPAPRQQNMDQVAPTQQMQSPSRPPDGFTKCADENGEYNFSQPVDVAYGANGKFAYRRNVTGNIKFSNANFGDPAPGDGKSGYYKVSNRVNPLAQAQNQQPQSTPQTQHTQEPASSAAPAGYTKCADENGEYNFSQAVDVAYGANGKFAYRRNVTGNIKFSNANFGDPAPGDGKSGYYKVSNRMNPLAQAQNQQPQSTPQTQNTPQPTSSSAPAGYTKCADENGEYNFSQAVDVAYGANGKFAYKRNVTGNITFSNAIFGDPAPGDGKSGYYKVSNRVNPLAQVQNQQPQNTAQPQHTQEPTSSSAPAGYTKCADENGEYNFSQAVDVAYGANGKFTYRRNVTGNIRFSNAYFGDPAPGAGKAGYYKVSSRANPLAQAQNTSQPQHIQQSSSAAPEGYIKCADENDAYLFTQAVDVAYGANGKFVYQKNVSGVVNFNSANFGDPAPNSPKAGYFKIVERGTYATAPHAQTGVNGAVYAAPANNNSNNGNNEATGSGDAQPDQPDNGNAVNTESSGSGDVAQNQPEDNSNSSSTSNSKPMTYSDATYNPNGNANPHPTNNNNHNNNNNNHNTHAYVPTPYTGPGIPDPPNDGSIYVDVPQMPQSDINAVMIWIKNKTISEKLPFCWKQSSIVAPHPLDDCPAGKQKHLALCYPTCRDGYSEQLDRCMHSGCPAGFRDDGLTTCWKPVDYGVGAGRIPDVSCPSATPHQRGIGAASWCDDLGSHFTITTASSIKSCHGDEVMAGGFCYPKCRPGFHNTTNNFCTADCPPGTSNSGAGCLKDSYYNTAGTPLTCGHGLEQNGALCYQPCRSGFHNIGGVCWQNCEPGWQECGAGCSKTSMDCGLTVTDQVISVLTLAVNIATLGMAEPAAAGAHAGEETVQVGTKTMTGTSKTGKSLVSFVDKVKNSSVVKKTIQIKERIYNEKTKKVVETLSQMKDVYDFGQGVKDMGDHFYDDYADDFATLTSPEINTEIDNRFGPKTARYLKRYWANIQLAQMAGADGFQISQDVMGLVSIVDPTGVTAVVSAYLKPTCQNVIPFPTLSQQYR